MLTLLTNWFTNRFLLGKTMARVTSSVTLSGVLIAIAWVRQRRYLTSSLATQRVLGRLSLSLKRLNLYRLFPIVKHVISLRKHPYSGVFLSFLLLRLRVLSLHSFPWKASLRPAISISKFFLLFALSASNVVYLHQTQHVLCI